MRISAFLVALAALTLGPVAAHAQQWSPEQQAVWRVVESYNDSFAGKDTEGFLRHVHPRFTGWSNNSLHSDGAEALRAFVSAWLARPWTVLAHTVRPDAIEVFGDAAVAHYHFTVLLEREGGGLRTDRERWTDFLIREGGQWLLVGSHGGGVRLSMDD